MNFTGYELKILEFIQRIMRHEIVDKIFIYISYLGEAYLFIVIALILYWLFDKKWAYKFVTAFLTSTVVVGILKVVIKRRRPYQDSMTVESVGTPATEAYGEHSYSLPSGHSNAASSITTGVLKETKNKLIWTLLILNVILVPFSRMYLGQHYLTDVLLGVFIGFITVTLVYYIFSKIKREELVGLILLPFILAGVAVLIVFKLYNKEMFQAAGAFTAFAIGYLFEKKVIKFHPKDKRVWVQLLKIIIGLGVTFGLQQGLKYVLPYAEVADGATIPLMNFVWDAVRYFIIALWATVGATALFKGLFRTKEEKVEEVEKIVPRVRVQLPYQRTK
ncbi:MAG: phosphatase PAP2 family protein [Acholeplasmataceae bacterium]|jgi:undecaprenyl-diphosphatase